MLNDLRLPLRNPDGTPKPSQSILDHDLVSGATQQQPDAGSVIEHLLGNVGLTARKRSSKVIDGLTVAPMCVTLNLQDKQRLRPTVLNCFLSIPATQSRVR
jgi:hypothetical protein